MGGEIILESKKDIGTTFFVTIPYNPMLIDNNEKNKTSINEHSKSKNANQFNILIAEDEEINFLYLEILLKDQIDLHCNIIHA